MIAYDSKGMKLTLSKKFILNGDTPTSLVGSLDLGDLTNLEQQRLIAVAKLVVQFALNHAVDKVQTGKDKEGKSIETPSLLLKTQKILSSTHSVELRKKSAGEEVKGSSPQSH